MLTKTQATQDRRAVAISPRWRKWLRKFTDQLPVKVCIDLAGEEEFWATGQPGSNEPLLRVSIREPAVLKRLLWKRDPLIIVDAYLSD